VHRPSVDHATRIANARSPGNPSESIRRTRLHAQLDSLIFARRLKGTTSCASERFQEIDSRAFRTSLIRAERCGTHNAAWWRNAYVLSIAAAIFGAALTSFAWYEAFQQENRLADQELSARASDHFLALQNGIDQYINDISALRAAFQASEHGISRREFQSLSDDLFRDKPAIFGTSWIPRVARSERSAHELEAAHEGLAGYSIKSTAADGSLNPPKTRTNTFRFFIRRDRISVLWAST
jgi:hypothetical protein